MVTVFSLTFQEMFLSSDLPIDGSVQETHRNDYLDLHLGLFFFYLSPPLDRLISICALAIRRPCGV